MLNKFMLTLYSQRLNHLKIIFHLILELFQFNVYRYNIFTIRPTSEGAVWQVQTITMIEVKGTGILYYGNVFVCLVSNLRKVQIT